MNRIRFVIVVILWTTEFIFLFIALPETTEHVIEIVATGFHQYLTLSTSSSRGMLSVINRLQNRESLFSNIFTSIITFDSSTYKPQKGRRNAS